LYAGTKILEARELNKQQAIARLVDDNQNPSAYELGAIYRDGATLNVQPLISGMNVTLVPIDNTKPMLVFVRGSWEKLRPDFDSMGVVTLGSGAMTLYLNYAVRIVTSAEDPQLVDVGTGESTAQMGELDLSVSATDTSAAPLGSTQVEKNTVPIVLYQFTASAGVLVPLAVDNVNASARATDIHAGPVLLSTGTSAGEACASDDPRLEDMRVPSNASVTDAKMSAPVADGTNQTAIGTQRYLAGPVSAANILWNSLQALVSDGLDWLRSSVNAVSAAFTAHQTTRLGLQNTHPMPTAQDVGAAPASHVGQPLGISHPPLVGTSHGGFEVVRDEAVAPNSIDYAYQVEDQTGALAGITHGGDVWSKLANAFGYGGNTFGLMSVLAQAFSVHAAAKNPHGLTLADLGGASITYVDTQDAGVLAAAELFAAGLVPQLSLRVVSVNGGKYLVLRFSPNNGDAIELAYGTGTAYSRANQPPGTPGANFTIPLPSTNFTPANALPSISLLQTPSNFGYMCSLTTTFSPASLTGNGCLVRSDGDGHADGDVYYSWTCLCWREHA
jgi:hypothetical protein